MKNVTIILAFLIFLFSCANAEKKQEINFSQIQKKFTPSTQYKSILISPYVQKVTVLDLDKINKFEEYEYRNDNWKKTATFNSELLGNVNQSDFLFSLNDSIIGFVNSRMDSLKNLGEINGIRIATQNSFSGNNQLQVTYLYQENLRDKKLTIRYQ